MVCTRVSSKLLPQLLSRPVDHVPGTLHRVHCTGHIAPCTLYYPDLWTITLSPHCVQKHFLHQWWPTPLMTKHQINLTVALTGKLPNIPQATRYWAFTRVVTHFYSSALSSSSSSSSSWSCEWCWQVLRQKWRIPSPLPLFTFLQHNHHHRQHHHEDLHENYIIIIIFPSTITCQLYDDTAIYMPYAKSVIDWSMMIWPQLPSPISICPPPHTLSFEHLRHHHRQPLESLVNSPCDSI